MSSRYKVSPTRLVRGGRRVDPPGGQAVNPPVVRASTAVFPDLATMRDARARRSRERLFTYAAKGNPTGYALEDLVCELEGGYRTRLLPTGLAAIAIAFVAYLKSGDHMLVSDCVYEPTRAFVASQLTRLGVRATFFAPADPDLESKIAPATRLVYVESPGSFVYEMSDLPAIARLTRARGIVLVADNTWGSGMLYRPLELGADVSVMAATKYLSGHSDVMLGTVTATRDAWNELTDAADAWGMTTSPDDAYLVLRGMRTLATRLRVHEANSLALAEWLAARPEVARVHCPALASHPGHALWARDCAGTNGLVSFELRPELAARTDRIVDGLKYFGLGASWGGFESLVTVADMPRARSLEDWSGRAPLVRLHAGLEEAGDLIADLRQAFEQSARA
ncbi:MAG: cystathionine beta-lyase [Burkholderiales bacterium]|nr:cystathionine beta-lyase [Burkholderiales bacterium]